MATCHAAYNIYSATDTKSYFIKQRHENSRLLEHLFLYVSPLRATHMIYAIRILDFHVQLYNAVQSNWAFQWVSIEHQPLPVNRVSHVIQEHPHRVCTVAPHPSVTRGRRHRSSASTSHSWSFQQYLNKICKHMHTETYSYITERGFEVKLPTIIWFVAPAGPKVGSLKRQVRSHPARWEIKNCTPLWREAHFEVKMCKTHQVRSTSGSRDVEKVHAVLARSTFPSQNVQKTPQCRTAQHSRTTFGSWHVEKVHAVVARSTFPSQNVKNTACSDHFWTFRCCFAWQAQGVLHLAKIKQIVKVL